MGNNDSLYYIVYNESMADTLADILKNFNPVTDKYVSREFQSYGLYLAEELNDYKHRALYIKLAKTTNRSILEKALSYVKDANVDKKGALFMWKLKQLKNPKENEKK
jgi:uncharacterized protein YdiU (UPF0061 family)